VAHGLYSYHSPLLLVHKLLQFAFLLSFHPPSLQGVESFTKRKKARRNEVEMSWNGLGNGCRPSNNFRHQRHELKLFPTFNKPLKSWVGKQTVSDFLLIKTHHLKMPPQNYENGYCEIGSVSVCVCKHPNLLKGNLSSFSTSS
jgi:hypothetical protein